MRRRILFRYTKFGENDGAYTDRLSLPGNVTEETGKFRNGSLFIRYVWVTAQPVWYNKEWTVTVSKT